MSKSFAIEVHQPIAPDIEHVVRQAIEDNVDKKGPLLPILHHIQRELKHVPSHCAPLIAKALNLSRAEVHGVISFYHTFTAKPLGQHVIEVCRSESCQATGSRALELTLQKALGIGFGDTTADGLFSLESVFCLGNCACSPSVRIGPHIHGRVTAEKAESIINALKATGAHSSTNQNKTERKETQS